MAFRFQSTDWLAEYCCFALDNGVVVEMCTDSQETLNTVKDKVNNLFKSHRKTAIDFSQDIPRSIELSRTKHSNGGKQESYSTIMRNPKSVNNWPVQFIKFNSEGVIETWYAGSWVGFCYGQLVDSLLEATVACATPEEAYADISRRAEKYYSIWHS